MSTLWDFVIIYYLISAFVLMFIPLYLLFKNARKGIMEPVITWRDLAWFLLGVFYTIIPCLYIISH